MGALRRNARAFPGPSLELQMGAICTTSSKPFSPSTPSPAGAAFPGMAVNGFTSGSAASRRALVVSCAHIPVPSSPSPLVRHTHADRDHATTTGPFVRSL
jgi:hypothetical protein